MNAKVEISKQSILFYSALDAVNAYTSALNVAVQIRTLINQINKSILQVRFRANDYGFNPTLFSELENLTSISKFLVDSQILTYKIECDRHQDHKKQYKEYDVGDLFDVFSLAHENTAWLHTLLIQMIDEVILVKTACEKVIHPTTFSSLERLVHIAEYFINDHTDTFNVEREKYEMQWEATKNG